MIIDDYLHVRDGITRKMVPFPQATSTDIEALEHRLAHKLPEDFKEALRSWQGKTIDDFDLTLSSGRRPSFSCLYHCLLNTNEYLENEISYKTSILKEDGYGEIVAFSDSGNSNFGLDYTDSLEPCVVFVDKDYEPEDPRSKVFIANTFTEFLQKAVPSTSNQPPT